MTTFTDLLDEYLEAKAEHDQARASFTGYDFSYFHHGECERLSNARNALNRAMNSKVNERPGQT